MKTLAFAAAMLAAIFAMCGTASANPNYLCAVSDVEDASTSTAWVEKLSIVCPLDTADDWAIFAFAEYQGNSTSYSTSVDLQIDGTEYAAVTKSPINVADYFAFSTCYYYPSLAAGAHTIQLMFRTSNASAIATIRNARIVAIPKHATGRTTMVASYSGSTPGQVINLPTGSPTNLVTTPTLPAGWWFVMSVVEVQSSTMNETWTQVQRQITGNNRVQDDVGDIFLPNTSDYVTFMSLTGFNITSGNTGTVYLNAWTGTSGLHYRNARIMAIQMNSAFPNNKYDYGTGQLWPFTTTSTDFQPVPPNPNPNPPYTNYWANPTSWTTGTSGNWLLLGSGRLQNTPSGSTIYQTEARVLVDNNTRTSSQQLVRPLEYNATYPENLNFNCMDVWTFVNSKNFEYDIRTADSRGTAKINVCRFWALPLDQ